MITLVLLAALAAQTPDGAAIFASACATCHNGEPNNRAPAPEVLRQRSPEAILSALTAGGMRPQGGRLTGAERRAVAEYLSGRPLGGDITGASVGRCTSVPPLVVGADAPARRALRPSRALVRPRKRRGANWLRWRAWAGSGRGWKARSAG